MSELGKQRVRVKKTVVTISPVPKTYVFVKPEAEGVSGLSPGDCKLFEGRSHVRLLTLCMAYPARACRTPGVEQMRECDIIPPDTQLKKVRAYAENGKGPLFPEKDILLCLSFFFW